MSWLRAPIVHFLAGGAILFVTVHGARPPVAARPAVPRPIVLTAADVARLRTDYTRETGLEPTAADEAVLVEQALEEEMLFREARARGLDRDDRSVRNWLVEQMAVVSPEDRDDPDRLYARARDLGLDRTDLVVRRIVVRKLRLLAARLGERLPTEAELEAYWARHRDEYRAPDRWTFRHVFLSPEARGARIATDAAAMLRALRRGGDAADAAMRRGDAFPLAPRVADRSVAEIVRTFGDEIAGAVAAAAPGRWIGPVRSPYGLHLLRVESHTPGAPPALAAVRGRVVQRWLEAERTERVQALIGALKVRYPAQVASSAWRDRRTS